MKLLKKFELRWQCPSRVLPNGDYDDGYCVKVFWAVTRADALRQVFKSHSSILSGRNPGVLVEVPADGHYYLYD